jgi:Ca-activated chloride channel homolog
MFNPAVFENSRPDGIGVLEIIPDSARDRDGPRLFVPLRRTELRGEIVGPLAALSLTQVFAYTPAQCPDVLEAVYRFPLPGDAAVTGVRVRFGDVEIHAELRERERAEADYAEAVRAGRQAVLTTRESPDMFSLHVAGIHPDDPVSVETTYVQLARQESAGWTLRVPLTTAPRYVRPDEEHSRHAAGQPLFLLRDPGHRFALALTVQGAAAVASPTHALAVTDADGAVAVRLRDDEVVPDRDCVLTWQPRQAADQPALQVWLHDDAATDQVYFLALAAPPAAVESDATVPREVVLLVDHSGSMEGPKWVAADWAVRRFLRDLGPRDAFALGVFHNTTTWFAPAPRPAEPLAVDSAIRFLETARDSGGTELRTALEQALRLDRLAAHPARHVLLVTDAEVTDEGRILALAERESQRRDRRRISVLCVDAAPNSFLAHELAERSGGAARFLTSAPEEDDVTTALDEVLSDWAQPVLAGLRLEVSRPAAEAAGRQVLRDGEPGWSAIDLGDLPTGRAVWVAGRVPRGAAGDLAFRLATAEQSPVAACWLDLTRESAERPALKALFGARRVLGLEFLIATGHTGRTLDEQLRRLGYDPRAELGSGEPRPPDATERPSATPPSPLQRLLAREALAYGLASAETAFVAVRDEAGQRIAGRVPVANALPASWSAGFLAAAPPLMPARPAMGPALAAPAPLVYLADVDPLAAPAYLGAQSAPTPPPPSGVQSPQSSTPAPGLLRRISLGAAGPPSGPSLAGPSSGPGRDDRASVPLVFEGVPTLVGGEAMLFDSTRAEDAAALGGRTLLQRLVLEFPAGAPASLPPGLRLLVFVDDLAAPRARVPLADLVRQNGERPLNLVRQPDQIVRVVLADPAGAWAAGAPRLVLRLG